VKVTPDEKVIRLSTTFWLCRFSMGWEPVRL